MRLGVLGGTFDPIHLGHVALASAAQNQFGLDKVLFIPAFIPPHKSRRQDLTPAPYRFQMVKMALAEYLNFEVSDIEIKRTEISYTVETLRSLKEIHRSAELFLILGADTLKEVPTWRDYEAIEQLVTFLVAPRKGAGRPLPDFAKLERIDMPEFPVSSSSIRQKIREGGEAVDSMDPRVSAFVREMNLYRGGHG